MVEQANLSPEQLLIKKVVESQNKCDSTKPTSFVLFSNDLKFVKKSIHYICHAEMRYAQSGVFDQIVTAAPFTDYGPNLRYYQFLINGPFRAFSDKISLEMFPGTEDFYIRCTDLSNWPANILFNFCIATRIPIESPHIIKTWDKFLNVGVDPTIAFIVSTFASRSLFKVDDPWLYKIEKVDFERNFKGFNPEHLWFDVASEWTRLLNGDFDTDAISKVSFKETPSKCSPCNGIWGYSRYVQKLFNMSVKDICAQFDLPTELVEFKHRRPRWQELVQPEGVILPLGWPNVQGAINIINEAQPQWNIAVQHAEPQPIIDFDEDDDEFDEEHDEDEDEDF